MIFLHGAVTRGDDLTLVKSNVSFCNLQRRQTARGYLLLAFTCVRTGNPAASAQLTGDYYG